MTANSLPAAQSGGPVDTSQVWLWVGIVGVLVGLVGVVTLGRTALQWRADLAKPRSVTKDDPAQRGAEGSEVTDQQLHLWSTTLAQAAAERLSVMPDVALAKGKARLPIVDAEREKAVVNDFVSQLQQQGLSPTAAYRLISSQMEAARMTQEWAMSKWTQLPDRDDATIPSLEQDLRPKIDAATQKMQAAWAMLKQAQLPRDRLTTALATAGESAVLPPGVTPELWQKAWDGVTHSLLIE
jgi:chorismate mutase-like protein